MPGTARELTPSRPEHRAVAFLDLSGFTSLTAAHGDEQAAHLQQHFARQLSRSLQGSSQCVKHLGDGAMLVARTPAELLTTIMALTAQWSLDPSAPLLRGGLHAGEVQVLDGAHGPDFLGTVVNLAARLCDQAAGGELLLSHELRDEAKLYQPRDIGLRRLRGLGEVGVLSVTLQDTDGVVQDPVCGMPVRERDAAATVVHDGTRHLFCSLECVAAFSTDVTRYL